MPKLGTREIVIALAIVIVGVLVIWFTATPPQSTNSSNGDNWYSGGHLSSVTMSQWMQASSRERLATSADIATKAFEIKFGSSDAAAEKLGSMDNLRPYAIEVETCISAAGAQPPNVAPAKWQKVLETQRVPDIAAACIVSLNIPN
jgi:hypothetical protein